MGLDKTNLLGSLEWKDTPLMVPDLQIKFLHAQVVVEEVLKDQSNEHNRSEWKLSKKKKRGYSSSITTCPV